MIRTAYQTKGRPAWAGIKLLAALLTCWTVFAASHLWASDDSAKEVMDKLTRSRKLDHTTITQVKREDVYVVTGQYDFVEKVLDVFKIPYIKVTSVTKITKGEVKLDTAAAVIVNCGLTEFFTPKFSEIIRDYVGKGGYLFTSDWALPVITSAFPGYLEKAGETLPDPLKGKRNEQVVITANAQNKDHVFLKDVFPSTPTGSATLKWALEIQAFCFQVKRPDVKVLIESAEMKQKYGSEAVAVTFDYPPAEEGNKTVATGKPEAVTQDNSSSNTHPGTVLHIVSHLHQQGLDNKTKDNVSSMYQLIVNFLIEAKKGKNERVQAKPKK